MKKFIFILPFLFYAPVAGAYDVDITLFEQQSRNEVEPINLGEISKLFPQVMNYGYAGKVLLEFNITADGRAENVEVVLATRDLLFDKSATKLLAKFRFAPNAPKNNVRYEMGFCLQSDRLTPVLCDIQFVRTSEGAGNTPKVIVYSLPYYNYYAFRKGICGWVDVRFDVNERGLVRHIRILNSSRPGQFEISLKRALARFRFELEKPATGIEYRISFSLPGRCDAS